jgi:hypothetical protein
MLCADKQGLWEAWERKPGGRKRRKRADIAIRSRQDPSNAIENENVKARADSRGD